ncbi:MAG: GNAT family N-acetyltransferase [Proteobacteria bacterium]|nr:GNAT family N-acetyltransferase [Pseudomonadota bacterium]
MSLADYIHHKPVIESERLYIRPMTPADIPALQQWMPDKNIYTYWGKRPGKTDKDPKLMFENDKRPSKSFHLGIAPKDNNQVIGDIWVYLIENDRMASIAIRISPACQRKGYGTEAVHAMTRFCFENTELQRLWTEVDVRNVASQKMLEKCGYIREGHIRQGKMINSWCDYYIYGILKTDFNS